ncbi:hypothetical protein G4O51_11775 [Candidatus Bathyarchaeota archaeon A05DMB-2]|jgi:hypothetical protein|nr:hypothetical protein [Candidatus Bathyarchaeota archaeon A05DMB-2]
MSQETNIIEKATVEQSYTATPPASKEQITIQELIDALNTVADDVGQISELTSEEALLVSEFFASLLKLMQSWVSAISISPSALPPEMANVAQANVDPTGHLAVLFRDGRFKLMDLSEPKNRDLLIAVIRDMVPKFKQFSASQKRKIENRIQFLSQITKEIQRIASVISQST